MNQADITTINETLNLPANKKAKAIQKRRAAENTAEVKQQKRSAAIYLRVSSEMQLDGFSIEAQKNACLKYAKEQGYEITDDHIYIDEAFSAKNEDRPAFKRMIIAAHSCEFSLIIIHKMDRFERNFKAMRNTLEDLANIGVRVFSISENLELVNTLTVNLFGIINEHYLQNLSWETAKGKHQAAKEGYFIGSRVPFGYRKWKFGDPPDMDKRLLLKDEREAPALQHCFEMYATGNCSFMDLANFLNENGFVSRSGRSFRDDTLRTMLENPIYIGIIEYQGTGKDNYLTYRGKHTPLVSTELFNRVAEVREKRGVQRARSKYGAENLKAQYLVQNLICCESCRRKLRVYTTEYSCNYKDYSEERGLECKDSGKQILAPFLDGLVTDFLSSIFLPRNWVDKIVAKGSEADTCREIKEQITRIRNRMERRRDAYTVFGIHQNFEKYEREQKADQQQIDELTQKLPKDSAVINTQITLTTSLIDLFVRATKTERYDIVHFLFSKLYVDLDSHCLTAFEPQAEFEFLFSAFAEENGWKKDDGGRYLLPIAFSASYKDYLEKRSEETQKKKGNTIKSHRYQAATQGYFTNSSVPFGYKRSLSSDANIPDARILLIDSPAARAVRKCFDLYSSGKYTYDELADMLNKRGFLTSKGKPFCRQNIYCMLKNQVYIGQIVYKNEIYPGRHEAIISRELWDRVQQIRRSNNP